MVGLRHTHRGNQGGTTSGLGRAGDHHLVLGVGSATYLGLGAVEYRKFLDVLSSLLAEARSSR